MQRPAGGGNSDTTAPVVRDFAVTPDSVSPGGTFTIKFYVSDTGGSGLNRVELWRKSDSGNWGEVKRVSASGATFLGSFTDAPSAGGYWYGVHVVDGAGNWSAEPAAVHVTVKQEAQQVRDDAAFDGQSQYPTITVEETVRLFIRFKNSGTSTWRNSDGYRIVGNNEYQGKAWNLTGDVPPGGTTTFTFDVKVSQPGTYRYGGMIAHNGNTFGPYAFIDVTVNQDEPQRRESATLDGQSQYPTVDVGESVNLFIRFRNTGNATWRSSDGYRFVGNSQYQGQMWNLSGDVPPGGTATFNFEVKGSQPGTFRYGVTMAHNATTFGPFAF
ncbi:MAG: hypothetical protein NTZ05_16510, partial [Chloroflexi bacterium]|nr:hypothetical protein [Chloroflexota bacterium]